MWTNQTRLRESIKCRLIDVSYLIRNRRHSVGIHANSSVVYTVRLTIRVELRRMHSDRQSAIAWHRVACLYIYRRQHLFDYFAYSVLYGCIQLHVCVQYVLACSLYMEACIKMLLIINHNHKTIIITMVMAIQGISLVIHVLSLMEGIIVLT